jgi:two-component sensor histidine kinase
MPNELGGVSHTSNDVGDPKRGEPEFDALPKDELAYRLRQQELVAEFGLFALRTIGIDELLHHATRIAADGMNVDLCKFLEFSADHGDLLVRAGVGWKDGTIGVARLGADIESPAGYAYQTQQSVLSNHLEEETRFRTPQLLVDHRVRRALNVPVKYDGKPYGILEVDSTRSGKFTIADIAFMQGIANTLAVAIERSERDRDLTEAREREALFAAEMRHRVKNVFAVINGLISMSRREAGSDVDAFATLMSGRIVALSSATEAGLSQVTASGLDQNEFDPVALLHRVLKPYGNRIKIVGTTDAISQRYATPLALVVHELATNAMKYGALSSAGGRIAIQWSTTEGQGSLCWREYGAPHTLQSVGPSGFGSSMINRILASVDSRIEHNWNEDGLTARIMLGQD